MQSLTHTDISIKWATTCDFQRCSILTWIDSDEPVQPPFKLTNAKCYLVSSNTDRIIKWLAKALIRLHVCAGWSEPLLATLETSFLFKCLPKQIINWNLVPILCQSISKLYNTYPSSYGGINISGISRLDTHQVSIQCSNLLESQADITCWGKILKYS